MGLHGICPPRAGGMRRTYPGWHLEISHVGQPLSKTANKGGQLYNDADIHIFVSRRGLEVLAFRLRPPRLQICSVANMVYSIFSKARYQGCREALLLPGNLMRY